MATTKSKRAELESLRSRDAVLRACAYPQFPKPEPMPACPSDEVQEGWTFNDEPTIQGRGVSVYRQWRQQADRGLSSYAIDPRDTAKKPIGFRSDDVLYTTEQDAHRALAYAVADHFGAVISKVYAKCF